MSFLNFTNKKLIFISIMLIGILPLCFGYGYASEIKSQMNQNSFLKCWGWNYYGQLGNGKNIDTHEPGFVKTGLDDYSPLKDVKQVVSGHRHTCALLGSGNVKCWGSNEYGQLGNTISNLLYVPTFVLASEHNTAPLSKVKDLTSGADYTCGLLDNGTVKCWGLGYSGQLGNNEYSNQFFPVSVHKSFSDNSELDKVVSISAGAGHTCALLEDGTARCWGYGGNGELGDDTTMYRATPSYVHTSSTDITSLNNIVALSTGGDFSCALLKDSKVKCWGGILGWIESDDPNGDKRRQLTPTYIFSDKYKTSYLTDVTSIKSGYSFSCAILKDTSLKCWGENIDGALGKYKTSYFAEYFKSNDGSIITGVKNVLLGNHHSCITRDTNDVNCWGDNHFGQLGNEATTVNEYQVEVSGLNNILRFFQQSAFAEHSCAIVGEK